VAGGVDRLRLREYADGAPARVTEAIAAINARAGPPSNHFEIDYTLRRAGLNRC
jgi:hypothetical protein